MDPLPLSYRVRHVRPRWLRFVGGAAIAALVVVALRLSGSFAETDAALQVMGFDPDRSRLLASLVAEAIAVAVAVLVTGSSRGPLLAGVAGGGALFAHTFIRETEAALPGHAAQSGFDAVGWALTLLTLLVALLIVGWATTALSAIARRALIAAAADARVLVRDHRPAAARRPAVAIAVLLVLAVTLPVFGDMVNYTPDVRMHSDSIAVDAPANGSAASTGGATASLSPIGIDAPSIVAPATGGQSVVTASRPWLAWRPSGAGSVINVPFPAPWVGGTQSQAQVSIYLPPGYATSGRRYPVVYQVPWALAGGWTRAVRITSELDALINSGALPAEIMVFISEQGGPFPDSECANTADRREHFEQFVVGTVVPWVDSNLRSIPTAAARAVLGFSQGGFCAPMLALRHPDVFGSSLSISGYYVAGLRSTQTPNAWRVYGGDPRLAAASSPVLLAGRVPSPLRSRLFFELSTNPQERLFGPQYTAFAAVLKSAGIATALFPTPIGHSWAEVRQVTPSMLETLAQRWTATAVFR